ncbi:MAG: L-seryl-tRNA(Sec) selenium transferase [Acidimicrobiia bacterium]|nr:L-seryl-tRNA(Sec) selenium transferase [Acidimicrobiia bacterium]
MASHPPSVDALAASIDDGALPRVLLVEVARRTIAEWRVDGRGDVTERARRAAAALARRHRSRVINATGVLLHTNLGRAPLHPEAVAAAAAAARSYSPLEMDLDTGARGGRGRYATTLAAALCGAEAALIVGNNAGALLLAIAALAGGREVIVSRGEMIEIGGSFRLPEIVAAGGARSIEIGTTNRTRLADYRKALGPGTGAILKVHPSNYRVEGFTEEVSYRDLAGLAADAAVPFVADIGSGLLDERAPWTAGSPPAWLAGEPGARQLVDAGADLVLFSGDKLLGGPQAGIIVGRAAIVERLAAHPLARAVRVGGVPLAALSATLHLYAEGRGGEIPFWAMAAIPAETLARRCHRLVEAAGVGTVVEDRSLPGAGSVPGRGIPGPVVAIAGGDEIRSRLLAAEPPIVARLDRDRVVVDLRAVDPGDDAFVAGALTAACR